VSSRGVSGINLPIGVSLPLYTGNPSLGARFREVNDLFSEEGNEGLGIGASSNARTIPPLKASHSISRYRIRRSIVTTIHPQAPTLPSHSGSQASGLKWSSCTSTFTPAARN